MNSEQLELDLFPGEPWNGRSPRGLTKVQIGLFLGPEPPGHEVYLDPEQLSLFDTSQGGHTEKRRRPAVGAPSLLPLQGPRRGRRTNFFFRG